MPELKSDDTMKIEAIGRTDPDWASDEKTTLVQFLDYQRDSLELKAVGLTDEQAASAACSPSILTLTGLVRHLAEVERNWFRRCFTNEDVAPIYYSDERPDGDLEVDTTTSLSDSIRTWRAEIARADKIVAEVSDLGTVAVAPRHGNYPNLRWILVHMIEEYARHMGHADLIRERIDGVVGD